MSPPLAGHSPGRFTRETTRDQSHNPRHKEPRIQSQHVMVHRMDLPAHVWHLGQHLLGHHIPR